jgi:hypothetical protein
MINMQIVVNFLFIENKVKMIHMNCVFTQTFKIFIYILFYIENESLLYLNPHLKNYNFNIIFIRSYENDDVVKIPKKKK